MQRRPFLTATTTLASAVIAGCSGTGGGDNGSGSGEVIQTDEVSMIGNQFDPRNIHVPEATTVTWTNEDATGHTVTNASDNWSFDTEVAGGTTAQFTFEEAAVYDVYCRFHGSADLSGMSMKIGVGDATIESPLAGGQQEGGGAY